VQTNIKGLCVKANDYGETGKILTIISFGSGKVVCSISGIKSPKSKLKMSAMPLAYGEYTIYSKGKMNKVISALTEENFFNCWNDFEKYSASQIILELLDKVSYDGQNVDRELRFALSAISLMNYTSTEPLIFVIWFILKIFTCVGIDFSDYEINKKTKGLFEAMQDMDAATIDAVDIPKENLGNMLNILSMIINNALDIKLVSFGSLNKAKAFEMQIAREMLKNKNVPTNESDELSDENKDIDKD